MSAGLRSVLMVCRRLALAAALLAGPALALDPPVRLAVVENEPYAGPALPALGYAPDLMRALLARRGIAVEFVFYPARRARSLTESGDVDGWLPVYADPGLREQFELSPPFPGGRVGLLKRHDLAASLPADARQRPAEALAGLAHLRFGASRATLPPEAARFFEQRPVERVALDLQNLDKLANGRIDLALMDANVAADLMALHRPHLIGTLELMRPTLFETDFHVAFLRGRPRSEALRQLVADELAAMAQDGSLQAVVERHGLGRRAQTPDGRLRLTIGTVNNPDMQVMQALSGEFVAANPDIRLEWRVLDEGTLRRRTLSDLFLQDGQFDIVTVGPNETQSWARAGWLLPITGLPADYQLDDLLPAVRDSLSVDGALYALPFYGESSMTYYRRDLLLQAGLDMPVRPSVEDIEALAKALHRPADGVYGLCLRGKPGWGENMAIIGTLIHTFGGRWFDLKWMPQLDSPPWLAAVGWYVRVLREYGPPNAVENGFNENLKLFADGKCAIWIDATVAAGRLFQGGGKVGFAAAPKAVTERGSHWLWTWALAVPGTAPHRAQAMAFAAWATSRGYIDRVARREGWVGVPPGTRASTYARPEYRAAAPFAPFVRDALETADVRSPSILPVPYEGIQVLNFAEFPAIGHQVGVLISQALTGARGVSETLAEAQRETLKQMRDSGYVP